MLEKTLHAGNIAANFGVVATAADLTICGGAATTIGAALSTTALFNGLGKRDKSLVQTMADAMQKEFDAQGLQGDRKILVAQVLSKAVLTEQDLIEGNLAASTIAKNLRDRIHDETEDPEIKGDGTLDPFEDIVFETLQAVLAEEATTKATQGAVNRELLTGQDEIKTLILNYFEQSGEAQSARESGVTDAQIIALAQEVAEDISDPNEAFRELEAAVEDAKAFRERAARGSNLDTVVGDLLKRLQALVDDGKLKEAQDEASETLARWETDEAARAERAKLTHIELIDTALNRDLAVRDPESAARRIVQKADLEAGGQAEFDTLRTICREWMTRGRDEGLVLDQEVAIAIADNIVPRAASRNERGAGLNDLGIALQERGARESGTERLEQAVAAFQEALKKRTRDRVPLDWAMTQNNLGNALWTLGVRESGTERLQQAVAAYQDALKERTGERVPLNWAATQNNLGNALLALGQRESGTERLEQAVAAYQDALKERTRDRVPLNWAMTQNNLGNALWTLGERESGTERLEQAVAAYEQALKERTRDRVPLDWAMTQNNLGNALLSLGERESGTERLQQAVAAFGEALKERTRDRVPLDWAGTTYICAMAEAQIAERTNDLPKARAALPNAVEAQAVLHDGGHEVWAGYAANVISEIEAIIAELEGDQD